MREETVPPELRRRRDGLDEFGDLALHGIDEPDAQTIRARLEESLMDPAFLSPHPHAISSAEHLQRALFTFRRQAYQREKAWHHEILMLAALVLMVLAMVSKCLWTLVAG